MNKSQLPSIKTEIAYKLLYAGLSATATDKTGQYYFCKTQVTIQPLIEVQSSNSYLISTHN